MPIIDVDRLEDEEKAAWFSCFLYNECMELIYDIIGECTTLDPTVEKNVSQKIKHIDIANEVLDAVKYSTFFKEVDEHAIKMFQPVIQSAGFYNLDLDSRSDENYFRDDVIILHFSVIYNQYCSTIIRTIMVTPTSNQSLKKKYKFLLRIQKFVITILRDGVQLGRIYQDTFNFVQKKRPELLQYLSDNFGLVTGSQPKDENYVIKANATGIARENTIYNVNVGLHSMYDARIMEQPPHTYSLWIGDCVKVEKGKRATLLKHTLYTADFPFLRQSRKIISNE